MPATSVLKPASVSVRAPQKCVARAHLLDRLVLERQQRQHALFQWHGDAETTHVEPLDDRVQFLCVIGLQRQIHRIGAGRLKGRILHARRQGSADWGARYAVNLRLRRDAVDAVHALQRACGDLRGGGAFARVRCGKREHRTEARPQHARHHAGHAHRHRNQVTAAFVCFQQVEQAQAVTQILRRGHNLEEVGRVLRDALRDLARVEACPQNHAS